MCVWPKNRRVSLMSSVVQTQGPRRQGVWNGFDASQWCIVCIAGGGIRTNPKLRNGGGSMLDVVLRVAQDIGAEGEGPVPMRHCAEVRKTGEHRRR
jgi:hypothetical protein